MLPVAFGTWCRAVPTAAALPRVGSTERRWTLWVWATEVLRIWPSEFGDDDEVAAHDGQAAVGAVVRGVLDAVRRLRRAGPERVVALTLSAGALAGDQWRGRLQPPARGRSARASARQRPRRGAPTRAPPPPVRRQRGRRDVSCSCCLLDPGRSPSGRPLRGCGCRQRWPRRMSGGRRPAPGCGEGRCEHSQRPGGGSTSPGPACLCIART